jgi:hypothetical protein
MSKRHRGGKDRAVSLEEAPGLNTTERQHLKVIWNRVIFLETRIAATTDKIPFRDKKELAALLWLIEQAAMPAPTKLTQVSMGEFENSVV